MKRETAFIAAVAVALALPGCEYFDKGPTTPAASPSPGTAALSIAVAPDPLKILWVCPIADTYCFGSLDSTVTVTETAGVGGRVDNVDFTVRDALLGIELTTLHLSSDDIKAKAGTNRIEAMGKLAVRPIVEGYPVKKDIPRPSLNIDISVQMTDDKNNIVKQTKRVPVA
ncbi:MAG TPA: hypothetical protein VFT38_05725 [Vicinamibacteria bacterium]|nr:hypothetical protein [Vicinamibacteria bacterium]